MKWIKIEDKKPEENQEVFYYFDFLGVFAGIYNWVDSYGSFDDVDEEFYMDCFSGDKGFLCDDVTHWMPREVGDKLPDPPEGHKEPECEYCNLDNYVGRLFNFDDYIDGGNQNFELYIEDDVGNEQISLVVNGTHTELKAAIVFCPVCGKKLYGE